MMKKLGTLSALLFAAGIGSAQMKPASATTTAKHYRLTFVLNYPNGKGPQSYSVDVPVASGQPGVAIISMASGSTGNSQATAQQTIQCTDVHESPTGLAASVSIVMDGEPSAALPDSSEPVHHHLQFNQRFDVALDRPTRISEEMHYMKLNHGVATEVPVPPSAAAPQITVMATEI
jgi:hypothetical protein